MTKSRITFEATPDQLAVIEELEKSTDLSRSMVLRVATRLMRRVVKAIDAGGKCYIDNGDGKLVEVFITF